MSLLPFRRIAILEPGLVFGDPVRRQADARSLSELRAWMDGAARLGADAVYARVYRESAPFARAVLEQLAGQGPWALLAPAGAYDPGLVPAAWHLRAGETDLLPSGIPVLKGRSCHRPEEVVAAQAAGMDYVFLSPVFSTTTHPEAPPLGLEKLREVCKTVDIPVFALGGIDRGRENACREAGAHGIAAIRMFLFPSGNA